MSKQIGLAASILTLVSFFDAGELQAFQDDAIRNDAIKLENAYKWSREKFAKDNAKIEEEYKAAIVAAQVKRAEAIKTARVQYLQGLKFLNSNPRLPQSMREVINDEMKRVTALPEPIAPKIEDAAKEETTTNNQKREIAIKLDAPDSGWSIQITVAKRVNDEIWVLSTLRHGGGISAMVITPVSDIIELEAPRDMPIKHFVLNKTWDGPGPEGIQFIDGIPELGRDWALGKNVRILRKSTTNKEVYSLMIA